MIKVCDDLRKAVLQAAIQGKLTEQLPSDGNAEDLYQAIQEEKQALIKAGKLKKEKPLPEITEDKIPFDIPGNWKWTHVGEVVTNVQYGTANKSSKTGLIPVLRMGNIQNGKIDYTNLVFTSDAEEIKHYPLQKNDLLFNRTNSREQVGKVAIYKAEMPAIYAGYLVRFTPVKLNSDYLNYVMQTSYYWHYCQSVKSDAIGQSNINAEKLKLFIFPLPPLSEQKRIVEKIDELMTKIDEAEKTEGQLVELYKEFPGDMKSAVLQAAIQGKLTEQLASDGDAETLYAEIQAEKKRLIKEGKIKKEKELEPIDLDDVPFDIPDNWKWVKIATICNLYTGNSIPEAVKREKYLKQNKDGYCYIGTKDISNSHEIEYSNGVYIPYTEKKFKKAPSGASLLCIEGGSAGKKIGFLSETVCFGNKLCMFYPYLSEPKLVYYWLQTPCFIESFKAQINGIIGGVNINSLSNIILPLPPLAEQKRIVERLDQLLPLCDSMKETIDIRL